MSVLQGVCITEESVARIWVSLETKISVRNGRHVCVTEEVTSIAGLAETLLAITLIKEKEVFV